MKQARFSVNVTFDWPKLMYADVEQAMIDALTRLNVGFGTVEVEAA